MKAALIGYSGFVGSNLKQQYDFTDLYNSKNFQEMKGQEYDLIVCAGVSAVKWVANKEPEKDLNNILILERVLSTVKANRFVLISTIDVYPTTEGKNEDFDCSSMKNHAYGTHRLAFERFCSEKFSDSVIVRLPGLFGMGLKKNVIFDLLNDNCLEMININSSYQYYYLKCLWKDIQIAMSNNIKLVNLFTEPVSTQEIHQTFFASKEIGKEPGPEGHYDLYTKYAHKWNKEGNYIYTKGEMLQQLSDFISAYQNKESSS